MSQDPLVDLVARDNAMLYRLIKQIRFVLVDKELNSDQKCQAIARLIEVAVGQPYEPR